MAEGNAVIDDENAEADEVEEVTQQDAANDVGRSAAQRNALEIAEDESQISQSDRAANAVAAGRDEHAEVRREHEAQLRRGGREVNERGEIARDAGRDVLQRNVDHAAGDDGHGLREQQQPNGKPRLAPDARPGKQEHNAAAIEIDGQGERDEGNESAAGGDEEFGAGAQNADEKCCADYQQTPPASAQLPAVLLLDAESEDDADRRNEHADRAQRIGGPASPQQSELALDAEAACRRKNGDGAPKRD